MKRKIIWRRKCLIGINDIGINISIELIYTVNSEFSEIKHFTNDENILNIKNIKIWISIERIKTSVVNRKKVDARDTFITFK